MPRVQTKKYYPLFIDLDPKIVAAPVRKQFFENLKQSYTFRHAGSDKLGRHWLIFDTYKEQVEAAVAIRGALETRIGYKTEIQWTERDTVNIHYTNFNYSVS